ncbi:MAG: hypothetical protein M0R38_11405 [Bacteroidia bacterium]|nr:hypothetical protein [Bacteroidia bacterium]
MSNVFTYDKKTILAFIDTKGSLSGELMKNIKFRRPQVIEDLKTLSTNFKVGDYAKISNYLFIVMKKNYRNKLTLETADKLLEQLPAELKGLETKTTLENYSELKDVIEKHFTLIEFCDTSKWEI